MKTELENLTIRIARPDDCAEEIANCIYLTDPNIYPAICSAPSDERWIEYIALSLMQKNSIFSAQNIFVAESDEKIVGICCYIRGGQGYTAECEGARLCETDEFSLVKQGYFDPLIEENLTFSGHNITNLCVLPKYRERCVGRALMQEFVRCHGDEDIYLDVLADNPAAISLYKKYGFSPLSYYNGFSPCGGVRCIHMIRKP